MLSRYPVPIYIFTLQCRINFDVFHAKNSHNYVGTLCKHRMRIRMFRKLETLQGRRLLLDDQSLLVTLVFNLKTTIVCFQFSLNLIINC